MINNMITNNQGAQLILTTYADLEKLGEQCARRVIDQFLADKKETYLTTQQATEMLHVDQSTLYRWDKSGYLSPIRLGSKKRYKLSDIEAIMENKTR